MIFDLRIQESFEQIKREERAEHMLTSCIFEIDNITLLSREKKREQTMELDVYLFYTSSVTLLRERERAGPSQFLDVLFDPGI